MAGEKKKKSALIGAIKEIQAAASSGKYYFEEIKALTKTLFKHDLNLDCGARSIEDILKKVMERAEAISEGRKRPGLRTGLTELDHLAGDGFNPGLVIFARNFFAQNPVNGESKLALNVACRIARKKYKVCYFSTNPERTLDFIDYYKKHNLRIKNLKLCHCDDLSFDIVAKDIKAKDLVVVDKADSLDSNAFDLECLARKYSTAVIAVIRCEKSIDEKAGRVKFLLPENFRQYAGTIFRFYRRNTGPNQKIDIISIKSEKNRHGRKDYSILLGHCPGTYRFVLHYR